MMLTDRRPVRPGPVSDHTLTPRVDGALGRDVLSNAVLVCDGPNDSMTLQYRASIGADDSTIQIATTRH